jgi:hypothetical protein
MILAQLFEAVELSVPSGVQHLTGHEPQNQQLFHVSSV